MAETNQTRSALNIRLGLSQETPQSTAYSACSDSVKSRWLGMLVASCETIANSPALNQADTWLAVGIRTSHRAPLSLDISPHVTRENVLQLAHLVGHAKLHSALEIS